jgi:hypothetical protein
MGSQVDGNRHRPRRYSQVSTSDREGGRVSPLGRGPWSSRGVWWRVGSAGGGLGAYNQLATPMVLRVHELREKGAASGDRAREAVA